MRQFKTKEENTQVIAATLEEERINLLEDAAVLLEKPIPAKFLLESQVNNIISICRFLKIVEEENTKNETLDILDIRIVLLESILNSIKNKETNHLYNYLVREDGIPYIIADIEKIDIYFYPEIQMLLEELLVEEQETTMIEGLSTPIYIRKGDSISILYTKKEEEITLLSVFNHQLLSIEEKITQKLIEQIILHERIGQPPVVEATIEGMLVSLLNTANKQEEFAFKLEKKN